MEIQQHIRQKLDQAFTPLHIEVENESHMHNVPEGSETHFRVLLVSTQFEGKPREVLRSDYAASGADVNGDDTVGIQEMIFILQVLSLFR